jgi:Amt family ammonium transporter
MKSIVRRGKSESLASKLSRLATRLRDKEWRRYGATLLAGKVMGVGLTLMIMAAITGIFFTKVLAADTTVKAADVVNPVNIDRGLPGLRHAGRLHHA